MKGTKANFILFFLFLFYGTLILAQNENTDSIPFVSGNENTLIHSLQYQIDFNFSDSLIDQNLSTGDLISRFVSPGNGKIISHFGFRSGKIHTGTDIKMARGDTIYAVFTGMVTCSKHRSGYGNLVVLQHAKNLESYYGHLSKFLVQSGSWVRTGEPVGLAGATGRATTSHLHFEIRENDQPYDPELVYDFENEVVKHDIEPTESLAALHQKAHGEGNETNEPFTQKYIVRAGDSLWKISRLAKTSIQSLCLLNNLTESSILMVGQVLMIY